MADFKKEIDEFVEHNGVGAHFEYTETGRKIKDKYGRPKPIIDNLNTLTKLAELLAKNSDLFIRATNFKVKLNGDLESYYYEAIYDIAPHYQKENGKTFSNFFIQSLTGAFRDIYKKDRIADPEFNKIRDSKTDNTKDNDTEEEDDKQLVNKISRFTGYTSVGEDGEEFERKELEVVESGYSDIEERNRVFDIALQILKILNSLTKSKQSMSRLFFTDDVIYWIEGEKNPDNLRIKHSQEVFENLDKDLLNYLMMETPKELIEILKTRKKTYFQLSVFLDSITEDKDVLSEYKAVFNSKKIDKKDETQAPESPIGNNMFLAFLYAYDCIKLKGTSEKPVMHPSAYITKYKCAYSELLKEFIEV